MDILFLLVSNTRMTVPRPEGQISKLAEQLEAVKSAAFTWRCPPASLVWYLSHQILRVSLLSMPLEDQVRESLPAKQSHFRSLSLESTPAASFTYSAWPSQVARVPPATHTHTNTRAITSALNIWAPPNSFQFSPQPSHPL